MGIHGNATCVMNYEGATGYLVGEPHKGMRTMFVMMNEARLGVGMQGLAQAEVAFQNAADFARGASAGPLYHWRQGAGQACRSDHRASGRAPHADGHEGVHRRWAGVRILDGAAGRSRTISPDAHVREKAEDRMTLLTPVIKGVPHRPRLQVRQRCAAACMAALDTRATRAWSSSCAMRGSR
jgi:alkylation response protein AidB-like acyl-CoA dehydrogenase